MPRILTPNSALLGLDEINVYDWEINSYYVMVGDEKYWLREYLEYGYLKFRRVVDIKELANRDAMINWFKTKKKNSKLTPKTFQTNKWKWSYSGPDEEGHDLIYIRDDDLYTEYCLSSM